MSIVIGVYGLVTIMLCVMSNFIVVRPSDRGSNLLNWLILRVVVDKH